MNLDLLQRSMPKIILGGLAALISIGVVYAALNLGALLFPPKLIFVSPPNGEKETSPFTNIAFRFDKTMSQANSRQIEITPVVSGRVIVSGQLVEFIPDRHLDFFKEYTVRFRSPKNSLGREGETVVITFTTKAEENLNADEINKRQGETDRNFLKAIEQGQNQELLERANAKERILNQLPYETEEFKVEYLTSSDTFTVTILKNPYEANKTLANEWFKSNGVKDLSWFKIEYGSVRGVF